MPESESDIYRRIAKQNGTSVEQERAKDAERERLRNLANGTPTVDRAEESQGGLAPVGAHSANAPEGANPFTTALVAIYLVGFVLGLILIAIGASNAASYDPSDFAEHTDNGVAWIVWGGFFVSLGITAAMVHLGAAAVIWKIERNEARAD